MSYKERLVTLNLLPLVLDSELKDPVFFYKCLFGFTDIDVLEHTSFIPHGRTRQSNSFNLKTPLCRTSTFKGSYFNRITKGAFHLSELAGRTITGPVSKQIKSAFSKGSLVKNHLLRAYCLGFD